MSREKISTISHEPVENEAEKKELDTTNLVEEEKSMFEKFGGKARNLAKALSLITFLTVAPVAVEQAYAKDKVDQPKVENVENANERAVAFLGQLLNLPDNPRAVTPAQNEMMKKTAARVMIQAYALERKGLSSGRVSSKDVVAATHELMDNIESYIDKAHGDGSGETSLDEMNEFRKTAKTNPGWRTLSEMTSN